MRLLVTGATGYVGRFVVAEARARGDQVTILSRSARETAGSLPFDLADTPGRLPAADALIHAALDHLPGKYRGGEGTDPAGFLTRNRDGSARLFQLAREAGIARIVFLSSRAIYGAYPAGTCLSEDLPPRPDTLYGEMKWQVEQELAARSGPDLCTVSLRATGIYGRATPRDPHKWQDLFNDFERGRPITPRRASEVHGRDLAAAVRLCLLGEPVRISGRSFNVSDLLLDRAVLLRLYAEQTGLHGTIPAPADGPDPNVMNCNALRALGWRPGGTARLHCFLRSLGAPP